MKQISDLIITNNRHISDSYGELTLRVADDTQPFPDFAPGQFVQIKVPDSPSTFLRRPISVCDADPSTRSITLLIRKAGEGTAHLLAMEPGSTINVIMPLGNNFSTDLEAGAKALLIGGGVGIAPIHMLGKALKAKGVEVTFLVGARSADMLLLLDKLGNYGQVNVSTDDGSQGVKGVVTQHPVLAPGFQRIYCCGPAPMMKAVAAIAARLDTPCEVSLENMMACGMGACLCCVENTVKGNVCVCTEGPVFNTTQLTWQI